jgi:hypothetical protein
MAREVNIYKAARDTISIAAGSLLTRQATPEDGRAWEVLQESSAGHDRVVVSAVQSDPGVSTINIKPTGLQPQATYEVQSVDSGLLGTATGAALMADGIDLQESPNSAAHLLVITARQSIE